MQSTKMQKNSNTKNNATLGARVKRDLKSNYSLYIMILPVLIFYLIFCYLPLYGIIFAFQDYDPAYGVLNSELVGFKHFIDFFSDDSFFRVFKNTIVISLSSLVFGFPAPILLALFLNELGKSRFVKISQTITYLPHFISLVVVVGMIKIFTASGGIINNIYSFFGGDNSPMLMNPKLFVPIYVISNIWQGIGWDSIIYIAAITGIDAQLYEACEIDGGGKLRQVMHVTIPGILPTIVIMLIMRVGNLMGVGYEKIILMYNPSTYKTADVILSFVYRKGLQEFDWSFASAVNLFNSVINISLLLISNKISRTVTESSLW